MARRSASHSTAPRCLSRINSIPGAQPALPQASCFAQVTKARFQIYDPLKRNAEATTAPNAHDETARPRFPMKFIKTLLRMKRNSDRSAELLEKLREAGDNQSIAINQRLDSLVESLNNQSQSTALNERLDS